VSRRVLSVVVRDRPGVLQRLSSLFARRGYNIRSLCVGQTETPGRSRTTVVLDADDRTIETVIAQVSKLIDVLAVFDHTRERAVSRELALVKVTVDASTRPEVMSLAESFRGRVIDVGPRTLILEVTGDEEKIEAFLDLMRPFGIVETMRSGRVALTRGSRALDAPAAQPPALTASNLELE
jgi:acetolactate synthase I/III small subunit